MAAVNLTLQKKKQKLKEVIWLESGLDSKSSLVDSKDLSASPSCLQNTNYLTIIHLPLTEFLFRTNSYKKSQYLVLSTTNTLFPLFEELFLTDVVTCNIAL